MGGYAGVISPPPLSLSLSPNPPHAGIEEYWLKRILSPRHPKQLIPRIPVAAVVVTLDRISWRLIALVRAFSV